MTPAVCQLGNAGGGSVHHTRGQDAYWIRMHGAQIYLFGAAMDRPNWPATAYTRPEHRPWCYVPRGHRTLLVA